MTNSLDYQNKLLELADEQVKTGDLIWVNSYNRDDGTKVCGYYRRK